MGSNAIIPESLEDLFGVGSNGSINLIKDRLQVGGSGPDLRPDSISEVLLMPLSSYAMQAGIHYVMHNNWPCIVQSLPIYNYTHACMIKEF